MLSFQKEQGSSDLPTQKSAGPGNVPGDGGGESPDQGYLTVAEHGKRTRRSTVVLAVMFVAGLCCLWFMIQKSTPQSASAAGDDAEGTKIESAIARLTGVKSEVFGRMDEIVRKFYEFSDVLQVQVGELSKNPFRLELFLADAAEENTGMGEVDVEALWKQQIRQKAENLGLSSIMHSESDRGNCCMIGSSILYEGDSVKGFKVRQIGDDFVKLEWEPRGDEMRFGGQAGSVEIVLTLSD
ncbi:MAG: hypothetical protein ACYS8I_15685 [Planctomycetota bacterium]|jgi:hypothetical protein